jgi:translation initiation factor IF-1
MPNNTKHISKKVERSSRKNKGRVEVALDDETAVFGRITKKLGFRRFQIILWDPRLRRLVPDIQARIGKKMVRVEINDIVNVAAADEAGREYEILAQFNGRDTARLQKEERIPPHLLVADPTDVKAMAAADPEVFEFDYDGAPQLEEEREVVGDEKKKGSEDVEPDLDIDAI